MQRSIARSHHLMRPIAEIDPGSDKRREHAAQRLIAGYRLAGFGHDNGHRLVGCHDPVDIPDRESRCHRLDGSKNCALFGNGLLDKAATCQNRAGNGFGCVHFHSSFCFDGTLLGCGCVRKRQW